MKSTSKVVITILICILVSLNVTSIVSAQSTVVKAEASASQPNVGDTLTVNVKISNVQNLFGVDVTLNWNPSVLTVVSATSQLGVESHSGGVLHETSSYPLEVVDDTASQSTGEYHLLATSTGSASPFSGSGTIATVTFNVASAGPTGLALSSELSDHPAAGGTANLIDHTDIADSVTAVSPGSSITPTPTSSNTPGPSPSPTIPEIPTSALITIIILTATIALLVKLSKNKTSLPIKKAINF